MLDPYGKEPVSFDTGSFQGFPGNGLSSQAVSRQVLSLLARFTTVFGMGTGGAKPPCHQGVYLDNYIEIFNQ